MIKVKFLGPKKAHDYYFHGLKKGAILTLSPFSRFPIDYMGDIMAICEKNQSYLLETGEYQIIEGNSNNG